MPCITVTVVPRSSKNQVVKQPDGSFKVWLTSPPVEGQANKKLIEVMSEYFDVPKSRVRIVKGERGRKKIIEIV